MGLRKQLLIVSLLTLALPWAGCQYVREMEGALRADHEASLADGARALAQVLGERHAAFGDADTDNADADVYAHPLSAPIAIDGYIDDWGAAARYKRRYTPTDGAESLSVNALCAEDQRYYYLYVSVTDDDVRYRDSTRGPLHDRLLLRFTNPNTEMRELLIETSAPGTAFARRRAGGEEIEASVRANWQSTADGFAVELRMPKTLIGARFGFAVIDGDDVPFDPPLHAGSIDPHGSHVGRLIRTRPELAASVVDFARAGRRVLVGDRSGWPLASVGDLASFRPPADAEGILARLYRVALDPKLPVRDRRDTFGRFYGDDIETARGGTEATRWYTHSDAQSAIVAASAPIMHAGRLLGTVTLEQPSAAILTLTNRALTRLVTLTAGATLIAAAGLLGFATWLSLRIRRLRNAAEGALSADGRISSDFPGSTAPDELGDLSRSFTRLLSQLREHTDYLRSLAGKLSHELRTPLAVVRSSLQNLESTQLDDSARTYAQRALAGTERLRYILLAMSEATRVEQSIEQADREPFDLAALCDGACRGYQDTYADWVFEFSGDAPAPYVGAPELLVQMLDKLVDNAVGFTPKGGVIAFELTHSEDGYTLVVSNEGPPLPEAMQDSLFDSMVSLREGSGDKPHLGFGLFIARLIVEFHAGRISARNRATADGVEFCVVLPVASAG